MIRTLTAAFAMLVTLAAPAAAQTTAALEQRRPVLKAEAIVTREGRSQVTEKDLVDAFFAETPFGFHGPMKTDMDALGIDYTQYGHAR